MKQNEFKISRGNLFVLQAIPDMMMKEKWRNKLREIALDYLIQNKELAGEGK